MEEYIVDIGSFFEGRTVKVEATNTQNALMKARKILSHKKFERIIQIRDDRGRFYYDYRDGIIED